MCTYISSSPSPCQINSRSYPFHKISLYASCTQLIIILFIPRDFSTSGVAEENPKGSSCQATYGQTPNSSFKN